MKVNLLPNLWNCRNGILSAVFSVFTLSLLIAAFGFTSLQAQTVAYVVNAGSSNVSVIDTSANIVSATIGVGNFPQGVVFSPDSTRVYVPNFTDSTISVIDTASNTVVATISLPGGSGPVFPAITPDGKSLYVPEPGSGNVQVVNTATNNVTATLPLGLNVTAAAITPDGAHAYVLASNQVSVIDTAANAVVRSIPVNSFTMSFFPAIAITPGGASVYVAGQDFSEVDVIATASNTVIAAIPYNGSPVGLVITPDGSKVYVAGEDTNTVSIIDTATNTVEPTTIPVGPSPTGLAVTPDGASVYVTDGGGNTVSVIDTATNTVTATVTVGSNPGGIAIANLNSPFAAFTIDNLVINNNLHEQGDFTLGANTGGIDLAHQPLTLTANNFSLTIPAGSFRQVGGNLHFVFNGTVSGLKVNFNLQAVKGSSTHSSHT